VSLVNPPVFPNNLFKNSTLSDYISNGARFAFKNCSSLVALPNCFNSMTKTSGGWNNQFESCFEGCESLTEIDFYASGTLTVGNGSPFSNMFKNCINLTRVTNYSNTYIYGLDT
jgi:hypothetical protein